MSRSSQTLARLESLFHEGADLTLSEMCDRLGLASTRHARRLVHTLRSSGLAIRERRDGRFKRFSLPEDERRTVVDGLVFDEEELFALTVAAEAARTTFAPTPLADPLGRAFGKLLERLGPAVYSFEPEAAPAHWHFSDAPAPRLDPLTFRVLVRAVQESRTVEIDYFTASRNEWSYGRRVDPLLLAVLGGSWILTAYCHWRREVKDFALVDVARVEPCDAFFGPHAGFDPDLHFRDRFNALAGGPVYLVRLLVEADRVPYFRRKVYSPTQQVETRADGAVEVSYEVAGLDEVAAFVRSWGPGVTVLEPPELAARIRCEAEEVKEKYEARD